MFYFSLKEKKFIQFMQLRQVKYLHDDVKQRETTHLSKAEQSQLQVLGCINKPAFIKLSNL